LLPRRLRRQRRRGSRHQRRSADDLPPFPRQPAAPSALHRPVRGVWRRTGWSTTCEAARAGGAVDGSVAPGAFSCSLTHRGLSPIERA
jgi:hypothetical protein